MVAALLSSLIAPVIEHPDLGLEFEQLRDVIAAVVFLAIAAVVGLVVGNAAAERRRATEREREARLLAYLSTKLLSGDVPDRVLDEFVDVLLVPFGLASCTVQVTLDGQEMAATATRGDLEPGGPVELVPVVIASIPLGTLSAERPARGRPFTKRERELLEAATRQAAVALDRARLDARARLAHARRRDEPAARGDVLLGHARPAHAARVDQGRRDEPARPVDHAWGSSAAARAPARRSWRRPTG